MSSSTIWFSTSSTVWLYLVVPMPCTLQATLWAWARTASVHLLLITYPGICRSITRSIQSYLAAFNGSLNFNAGIIRSTREVKFVPFLIVKDVCLYLACHTFCSVHLMLGTSITCFTDHSQGNFSYGSSDT